MKFFFPFLLALTFSLHAAQEGSATLPDNPSTSINDDKASLASDNNQETDPSLTEKESRYVVVSQKKPSPLMMFSERGKENSEKKSLLVEDLTEQQRRNAEPQDPSAVITRSHDPATISEKSNNTSSKLTLPEPCLLLFKTLTYCPGCKEWHTAANIFKKQLAQILFIKNQKIDLWHPLYLEDKQPSNSLLQRATSPSTASTGRRYFQFVTNDHGQQVLHHPNPTTGVLEKSSFQDPINALPAISYNASILLQTRALMPDTLAHFFLIGALEQSLEEGERILQRSTLMQKNEKTPLLLKGSTQTSYGATNTSYSSTSTEN